MADDVTARNVVDLALDDKPNAAGDVMNDILLDKIGDQVQGMKTAISNDMFGQELPEPDAEYVEVQPELDLEPVEDEDEEGTYEADQEAIEEPADEYEGDEEIEQPEESEEEKEE